MEMAPGIIYAPYIPIMFLEPDSVKGKIIDGKYYLERFNNKELTDTVEYFLKDGKWFRNFGVDLELEVRSEINLKELNILLRKEKLSKLLGDK